MEGYGQVFAWTIVALGAALLLGTGAALWRYARTGAFPGQNDEDAPPPIRGTLVRFGIGGILLLTGVLGLLLVKETTS